MHTPSQPGTTVARHQRVPVQCQRQGHNVVVLYQAVPPAGPALPQPGEDGEPLAGSTFGAGFCAGVLAVVLLIVAAGRLLGLV